MDHTFSIFAHIVLVFWWTWRMTMHAERDGIQSIGKWMTCAVAVAFFCGAIVSMQAMR